MKNFWKINIITSISIFIIFCLILINEFYIHLNLPFQELLGYIFVFGPFWEIIQIPTCIILYIFTNKKHLKYPFLYFGFMFFLFAVKISFYVWIMLEGAK